MIIARVRIRERKSDFKQNQRSLGGFFSNRDLVGQKIKPASVSGSGLQGFGTCCNSDAGPDGMQARIFRISGISGFVQENNRCWPGGRRFVVAVIFLGQVGADEAFPSIDSGRKKSVLRPRRISDD